MPWTEPSARRPRMPAVAGKPRSTRSQEGKRKMKKAILGAVFASTMLATPAFAADWQGRTYGQDAVGWYQLNANVDVFCRFGTENRGSEGQNATVTTSAYGGQNEADGRFDLDIQNDSDNTVQEAEGRYFIDNAVCNTPFEVVAASDNGGLRSENTTSDPAFIELVPYRVDFNFDGINGNAVTAGTAEQTILTSSEARAGSGALRVRVPARDKLVLEGGYSDKLVLTMRPTLGS